MFNRHYTIIAIVLLIAMPLALQAATLIGHWDFEEGSGSTAFDSSGNHLNGTIANASYTAGRMGNYALDFNGSNSYVVIGNNALLTPATITISLWFKSRASQQDYADILDKGHGWNTNPYYAGYAIQYGTGSSTDFGAFYGNGSGFYGANSGANRKDDQWHHLVTTLGQDEISLYMDGVLISKTVGQGPLVENGQNLYFGRHKNGVRFYNGLIDDVQIYSGSLSDGERNVVFGVPEPATALFCLLGIVVGLCRKLVDRKKQ